MARKKSLWEKSTGDLRRRIATGIKLVRGKDRGYRISKFDEKKHRLFEGRWTADSSLADFSEVFFGSPHKTESLIGEKLLQKKHLRILDLGCGTGRLLGDIGTRFGKKVELHGITMARPLPPGELERMEIEEREKIRRSPHPDNTGLHGLPKLKELGKAFRERVKKYNLRVHVGQAENHNFGKKFDLIFSTLAFQHSPIPIHMLENALNHLEVGGEAYLNLGYRNLFKEHPGLEKELEKNAVRLIHWKGNTDVSFTRTSKNPIRLSE